MYINSHSRFPYSLGGDPHPLWSYEPDTWYQDPHEVYRMTLDPGSDLYNALCTPRNPVVGLPTTTLSAGVGTAIFDIASFGAPFCTGSNTKCDSGTLLEGNSLEKECGSGDDATSCTIDGCVDGSVDGSELLRATTPPSSYSPQRFLTESVKQIIVESVGSNDLRGGTPVKIKATVISGENGFLRDRVDFYYAEDASNPDWIFITTVTPVRGEHIVALPRQTSFATEIRYTLPKCSAAAGCKQVSFCIDEYPVIL